MCNENNSLRGYMLFYQENSLPYAMCEAESLPWRQEKIYPRGMAFFSCWESRGDSFRISPDNFHPMFIRHWHPVEALIEAESGEELAEKLLPYIKNIPGGVSLALVSHRRREIEPTLREALPTGKEKVLSLTDTPDGWYMGLCAPEDLPTDRAGGIYYFPSTEGELCRAQRKLEEVFLRLDLQFPVGSSALDLGAAPGGWSRFLLEKDFYVTAVDPALMDPSVAEHPHLVHYRGLSQDYLREDDRKENFSLLINDMKMDARASVRVTLEAAELLSDGGLAIMTLKLPQAKSLARAKEGVTLFQKGFELLFAGQLFHNRSEITLVGKKRTSADLAHA